MGSGLIAATSLLIVHGVVPLVPPGARPLDAAWVGALRGHASLLVLRERVDGRLIGCLPIDPGTWVSGGWRTGQSVTIDLTSDDGAHPWTGRFEGSVAGATLSGTVTFSDLGRQPLYLHRSVALSGAEANLAGATAPRTVTSNDVARRPRRLRRWLVPSTIEYWVAGAPDANGSYRLVRTLDDGDRFLAGGYLHRDVCDFLGCSGTITAWGITGAVNSLSLVGTPDCPSATQLSGTWIQDQLMVQGQWVRSALACRPAASGDFIAGKEGRASVSDLGGALATLRDFADGIEAESPDAAKAFSPAYLNDGVTCAEWQAELADLYFRYRDLDVSVTGIGQVVTTIPPDTHPRIVLPPRLEWRLAVTGLPDAGGARAVVLQRDARQVGDEDLFWIAQAGGDVVFAGNGYAAPFAAELPIAAGDQSFATYGIWPYGAHGGAHPEGHPGLDFEYAPGAPIRASAPGTIDQVEVNPEFAQQWNVRVAHRSGFATWYVHIGPLNAGISDGATVTAGQALGPAGDSGGSGRHIYMVHFGLVKWQQTLCPALHFSAAATVLFDTIWADAAYSEELAEPFPCNPTAVSFPLTRTWTRSSGTLAPRIDFVRLDPHTFDYRYALRDGSGAAIETGTVSLLDPGRGPGGGLIDLQPDLGAKHLGRYRIVNRQLLILWGATRPPSLAGAAEYATPGP